jgi:hypothetical protein
MNAPEPESTLTPAECAERARIAAYAAKARARDERADFLRAQGPKAIVPRRLRRSIERGLGRLR